MRKGLKAFFIHFFVIVFFVIAALVYFSPVLQGKVIQQSDIEQYTGMAKEQMDFRKETGDEPYWTNSAFGGCPRTSWVLTIRMIMSRSWTYLFDFYRAQQIISFFTL